MLGIALGHVTRLVRETTSESQRPTRFGATGSRRLAKSTCGASLCGLRDLAENSGLDLVHVSIDGDACRNEGVTTNALNILDNCAITVTNR
jgi:hypothetical protein